MQNSTWLPYQPKKSMLAAEWILERVRSQVYPEGSKLPSEREIAQRIGMSRPPVRKALSALQIAGIVEIHPGDGTYVKSATPVNFSRVSSVTDNPHRPRPARLSSGAVTMMRRSPSPLKGNGPSITYSSCGLCTNLLFGVREA